MNDLKVYSVKIEVDGEVIVETEILARNSADLQDRLGVLLAEIDPRARLFESKEMGAFYE